MCNYSKYIATSGYANGYESGHKSGYESGYEIGYKIGYAKGVFEEKTRAAKNFFTHGFTVEDVKKMYPDLSSDLLAYLKIESDSQESE